MERGQVNNKENPWRFKLALIHRVNQKEILNCQLKLFRMVNDILCRLMSFLKAN